MGFFLGWTKTTIWPLSDRNEKIVLSWSLGNTKKVVTSPAITTTVDELQPAISGPWHQVYHKYIYLLNTNKRIIKGPQKLESSPKVQSNLTIFPVVNGNVMGWRKSCSKENAHGNKESNRTKGTDGKQTLSCHDLSIFYLLGQHNSGNQNSNLNILTQQR